MHPAISAAGPSYLAESGPDDLELEQPQESEEGWTSIVLFTVIATLMGTDLAIDFYQGVSMLLEAFEVVIFASALAGIAFQWRKRIDERRRSGHLDRELAAARAEVHRSNEDAQRWNQEAQQALEGLGAAINRQFDRWALTPAEREVALLQLKGLRHKAIAELRNTSERTVRQQALAIYRKSGLSGRPDLAAFFLEDLLLPKDVRHPTQNDETNER